MFAHFLGTQSTDRLSKKTLRKFDFLAKLDHGLVILGSPNPQIRASKLETFPKIFPGCGKAPFEVGGACKGALIQGSPDGLGALTGAGAGALGFEAIKCLTQARPGLNHWFSRIFLNRNL